jgi:superfamily I DNA and/or RNA helicase
MIRQSYSFGSLWYLENFCNRSKNMQEDFNGYIPITELQNLGKGIILWECEKDGDSYEVLHIPYNKEYERMLDRILQNEINPLRGRDIVGIQKIIDWGKIPEKGDVFIVYERLDDEVEAEIATMKDIAEGLNTLAKENHKRFVISKNNLKNKLQFVGLYEFFKEVDLLDREYLSPNVLEWLDGKSKTLPNFQDDIYSLIKCFEHYFETDNEIIQKGLAEERTDRSINYSDLIELLNNICLQDREVMRVVVKYEDEKKFLPILKEMNKYCELSVDPEKSKEKKQITVNIRTDNWQGVSYVDEVKNYIFIPLGNYKSRNELKNWFVADFSFSLDKRSTFDCPDFFLEKLESINQLAILNKIKKESVNKWQTMPEKEKEFIEENAFSVNYHNVQIKKANNAHFYLNNDLDCWEAVKKHKNESTLLYATTPDAATASNDTTASDGTITNVSGLINSDEKNKLIRVGKIGDSNRKVIVTTLIKVGKIGDYHSDHKFIIVKDILCVPEEIAEEGELVEDTRQKVSQFKKQIEACVKFLSPEKFMVNPVLGSILANPDMAEVPPNKSLSSFEYIPFKEKVFSKKLQTDETQLEAVLEAITYKPIYLIQGPPGTGKTTVIVECIRQIIKKEPNAKILITSQSNLAVDNVLEKIAEINPEEQNLKFMRLASENEDRDMNVTDSIKPHTYENKLKKWINETIDRNKKFMENEFKIQENNKILLEFYNATYEIRDIDKFKEKLNKQPNNYIKKLFENVKTRQNAEEKFEEILDKEYLKLKNIQKKWIAFLNNATNKKFTLNNGSEKIDFLTAMIRDMSIIGATCIHIASSKYSKINFRFDYVIMDESSKASPAETLVPINMGHNIILIGDHKQLPPVVTREDAVKQKVKDKLEDNGLDIEKEFGESLFEKLIIAFENDERKKQYIKMLDIQYRMPKQIGTLISKFFYDGKLKNSSEEIIPDFDEWKKHGLTLKKDTSIMFLSTSNMENPNDNGNKFKRDNECNMKYIRKILTKLNKLYVDNLQKAEPFTIGIIAGYRGQVELLHKNVNLGEYDKFVQTDENGDKNYLIEINTVDKFQGAERDIIIYDIVRSDKGRANIGFLDDYRRINVAFSRAKRLLIIVGDGDYIIKRATLNPGGKFPEFKLQQIAVDLKEQGLVFNNLEEIFE